MAPGQPLGPLPGRGCQPPITEMEAERRVSASVENVVQEDGMVLLPGKGLCSYKVCGHRVWVGWGEPSSANV